MKALRIILGFIYGIIALNAFAGGYYGMSGAENVPLEWLENSPFKSYFIPSLFLFIVIGGACLLASIMAFLNSISLKKISFFCSALLIVWICTQLAIIGYVSWLQPAIFISGLCILAIAFYPGRLKPRLTRPC